MNANITDPMRGGDILQWAQGVTETCRRFGGVGSANMLLREGADGLGYEALPQNLRERRSAAANAPGRFAYTVYFEQQPEEEGQARKIKFENCYYDIAGRTLVMPPLSTVSMPLPDGKVLFALKVDAKSTIGSATLVSYTDAPLAAMQAEQEDTDNYITPLYLFEDGSLVCDFRTGPYIAMGEIAL